MAACRVLLVVGLGGALGLFSWWGDRLPPEPGGAIAVIVTLASLPGPWLVTAFVAGAISSRSWIGAAAGLLALGVAVATYYLARTLGDGFILGGVVAGWLAVAALAGPAFGMTGGMWRGGRPRWSTAGIALLGGALLGEAALLTADVNPFNPFVPALPAYIVAAVAGIAGIALPLWLARAGERWLALALTAMFALAVTLATLVIF